MSNYEIVEFKTAKRFLDFLQIRQSRWLPKGEWTSPWVFRGHGDADWELKPRIWRKIEDDPSPERMLTRFLAKYGRGQDLETLLRHLLDQLVSMSRVGLYVDWAYYVNLTRVPSEKYPNLLRALQYTFSEVDAIRDFILEADRIGYPIPRQWEFGSWQDVMTRHLDQVCNMNHYPRRSLEAKFSIWDGRNHPATALAQHHGVPTSLLDWTQKPMIAALFAAEDVLHRPDVEHLAVWAINTDILDDGQAHDDGERRLQKLTVPRSELAYLHAQDSLFTYDSGADKHFILTGEWPSIEDVISREYSATEKPVLRKAILPASQVQELLRLLWAEGVTRALLMPGYDNVTKALESRWHWL